MMEIKDPNHRRDMYQLWEYFTVHQPYRVTILGHLADIHILERDPKYKHCYTMIVKDPKIHAFDDAGRLLKQELLALSTTDDAGHRFVKLNQFGAFHPKYREDMRQFKIPYVIDLRDPGQLTVWGHDQVERYGENDPRSHMDKNLFWQECRRNYPGCTGLKLGQPVQVTYMIYPKTMRSGRVRMIGIFDHLTLGSLFKPELTY